MRVINICNAMNATLHSPSAVILKGEHLVNFLYAVTGLNSFAYESRQAVTIDWLGRKVKVLPLGRILHSKKTILRPKDLAHIVELETLISELKKKRKGPRKVDLTKVGKPKRVRVKKGGAE